MKIELRLTGERRTLGKKKLSLENCPPKNCTTTVRWEGDALIVSARLPGTDEGDKYVCKVLDSIKNSTAHTLAEVVEVADMPTSPPPAIKAQMRGRPIANTTSEMAASPA